MQYAHRDPDSLTASKATTLNGFTRCRSDLLASVFSPSQPWWDIPPKLVERYFYITLDILLSTGLVTLLTKSEHNSCHTPATPIPPAPTCLLTLLRPHWRRASQRA